MIEIITALISSPGTIVLLALLNLIPIAVLTVLFVVLMRKLDQQTQAINELVTQNQLENERVKTLMDVLISKIK